MEVWILALTDSYSLKSFLICILQSLIFLSPIGWDGPTLSLSVGYYMCIYLFSLPFYKIKLKYIVWFCFHIYIFLYNYINSFGVLWWKLFRQRTFHVFAGALLHINIYRKINFKFEKVSLKLIFCLVGLHINIFNYL